MESELPPPKHAIEVTITIGAHDSEYVLRALSEILDLFSKAGVSQAASGGWHGCFLVKV